MSKSKAIPGGLRETERQSAELAAMSRMLTVSSGTSSLSISICNSPSLCNYLIGKLKEQFSSIEVVHVTKGTTDVYDFVNKKVAVDQPDAIFITGMEPLLPSDEKEHHLLKALNATRELWKDTYSCPVVFWMAEYAATLFSVQARDMWSWLSHQFEFFSEDGHLATGVRDLFAGDLVAAGNLDADQKHFRIAELEQRIQEAGGIETSGLTEHILLWLNELGFLYKQLGDLMQAEVTVRKVIEIEERLGRLDGMAIAYGNLGTIYGVQGILNKAEDMFKKSLDISEKNGLLDNVARQYGNLGLLYQIQGQLDKAEDMFGKSLGINIKLGILEGTSVDYGNLAMIYSEKGDLDKAEDMLKEALGINQKLGRLEGVSNQYGSLGLIYQNKGDFDKAIEMHTKSLDIDEKLGRLGGMGANYGNLGVVYQKLGNLNKALEMYEKSLEIDEQIGRLEYTAIQCANLGSVNQMLGKLDKAREYWIKSLNVYAKMGLEDMVAKIQGSIDDL